MSERDEAFDALTSDMRFLARRGPISIFRDGVGHVQTELGIEVLAAVREVLAAKDAEIERLEAVIEENAQNSYAAIDRLERELREARWAIQRVPASRADATTYGMSYEQWLKMPAVQAALKEGSK